MTRATHNGTCQACGRKQALRGTIAKHGYTVDYGYFSGTCGGSDRQPLELETGYNISTVAAIRTWADEQDAKANGEIKTVVVRVYVKGDYARGTAGHYENQTMNRDQFIEYSKGFSGAQGDEVWNSQVSMFKLNLHRNATFARKDADNLDTLREETFGNELEARDTQPELHRESFGRYYDASDRQLKLKEEGIKSTIRGRAPYLTLTYRK